MTGAEAQERAIVARRTYEAAVLANGQAPILRAMATVPAFQPVLAWQLGRLRDVEREAIAAETLAACYR